MRVWSRGSCRWVPWTGSRRAWLALPHAVVATGMCLLSPSVDKPLPLRPAAAVAAPPDTEEPVAQPWTVPSGYVAPSQYPGVLPAADPGIRPSVPVAEPGSLAILGTSLVLIAAARGRAASRLIRRSRGR